MDILSSFPDNAIALENDLRGLENEIQTQFNEDLRKIRNIVRRWILQELN
jgi:hypothetical protein